MAAHIFFYKLLDLKTKNRCQILLGKWRGEWNDSCKKKTRRTLIRNNSSYVHCHYFRSTLFHLVRQQLITLSSPTMKNVVVVM